MRIKLWAWVLGIMYVAQVEAKVWITRENWNADWETRYAEWSRKVWNERFFADSPSAAYHRLSVDCADAVYSKRLIFARENGLPFAIQDPTGGDLPLSNEMERWDGLPDEDQRVRAFLHFIHGIASTFSLPNDTYPAAVTPHAIRGGTVLLTDRENSHAYSVTEITSVGFPILIYASVPASVGLFTQRGFPPPSYLFPHGNTPASKAGFLNFRHPEHLGLPSFRVPGYSEQQYRFSLEDWEFEVQTRLASETEPPASRLQRLLDEACARTRDRVDVVQKALQVLAAKPANSCMSAADFANYSTPHRDARMEAALHVIRKSRQALTVRDQQQLSLESLKLADDIVAKTANSNFCPIEYAPGQFLTLAQVAKRNSAKSLSSNPNDPLDYRWGEHTEGVGPRGLSCPTY
jgi:hypothetical protein